MVAMNSTNTQIGRFFRVLAVLLCTPWALAAPDDPFGKDFSGSLGFPDQVTATPTDEPEITVSARSSHDAVRPGDTLAIAVIMDHAPGWHSWPEAGVELPEGFDFAIRTSINITRSTVEGKAAPIQWAKTYDGQVASLSGDGVMTVPLYSDTAVSYVPFRVDKDAEPGSYTITLELTYQVCDDTSCLAPETARFEIDFDVTRGDAQPASDDDDTFAGYTEPDETAFDQAGTGGGWLASNSTTLIGAVVLFLLSIVGGFVLNLTPCVLPVIPIKVMTISSHAGSPGKSALLGAWMFAGVVGFWLAIGLVLGIIKIAAGTFIDPSIIFGIWWLTFGIGALILVMGVGIMGVFTIKLPQSVYKVNPKADSAWGSFLFGVMTGVLGLPCFGFVAGALLATAAVMPVATIIAIFLGLGLGMGAPYFVLSLKPKWVDHVPRTGPASELVKQVMGLLMIAAALYFLGSGVQALIKGNPSWLVAQPWWGAMIHMWLIAVTAVIAGAWLAWKTFAITRSTARRGIFSALGAVIAGIAVLFVTSETLAAKNSIWKPFDAEVARAALEQDKVVVIDFTADWCLTCKAFKAAVLDRSPVYGVLKSEGVEPLLADLTSTASPGWDALSDYGRTGIPTIVIDGPGLDEPIIFNQATGGQIVDWIERARGGGVRTTSLPGP